MNKIVNLKLSLRKIESNESIPVGALHSLNDGETFATIKSKDSVGQFPCDFSPNRTFWEIVNIEYND